MTRPDTRRLDLDGELTISAAADQYQLIQSFLTADTNLELGLAGVTDLDTAGLQLLLFARREAGRLHSGLVFREPSRAVQDAFAIVHLDADGEPAS